MELAEKVYWELNKIFSSTHNDNSNEREESINILRLTLDSGTEEELFYKKMNQLVKKSDRKEDFKSKLSNAIKNRFWEKQFSKAVEYRPFKFDA